MFPEHGYPAHLTDPSDLQQYQGQVAEMLQNDGTGQISVAIDR